MKTALASVLAAGAASACCIGPVAFVLLGAGTFVLWLTFELWLPHWGPD